MSREADYFPLSLGSLRALGNWAAVCAERALPVFAKHAPDDARPRAAIDGIREFAAGGKRAARLRSLAMDAHRAGHEAGHPAATAAARAASLAASSAYTHPLRDVQQTTHVLGPAAYAALALELDQGGDPAVGDDMVRWAIEQAPAEVRDILRQMPARPAGKSRLSLIFYALDGGVRGE
jgi:hypothetical protein